MNQSCHGLTYGFKPLLILQKDGLGATAIVEYLCGNRKQKKELQLINSPHDWMFSFGHCNKLMAEERENEGLHFTTINQANGFGFVSCHVRPTPPPVFPPLPSPLFFECHFMKAPSLLRSPPRNPSAFVSPTCRSLLFVNIISCIWKPKRLPSFPTKFTSLSWATKKKKIYLRFPCIFFFFTAVHGPSENPSLFSTISPINSRVLVSRFPPENRLCFQVYFLRVFETFHSSSWGNRVLWEFAIS